MKRILITTICIVAFKMAVFSQLNVNMEYRFRTEYKDGFKTLSDNDTKSVLVSTQRTRLNIGYEVDRIELLLSVQDTRTWGEEQVAVDNSSINVHQAYLRYKINSNWAIKLGRQELLYDRNRLLGLKNWNNVSVSHDVAVFQFNHNNNSKFHLAMAYNNDKNKLFESDYSINYYKFLVMTWGFHKFSDQLELSINNILDGNQKEDDYNVVYTRGTVGFMLSYKGGAFSADASSYYQYGTSKLGEELSAYFFHFKPKYQVNENIQLAIGIDYLSGDDATKNDNKQTAFSNLYGDGHGYYGHMDYFTNVPNNTNNGGLNDIYFNTAIKVSKKTSLHLAFHNFRLANKIYDTTSTPSEVKVADKDLGKEIDASIKIKFYTKSSLRIGYSTMIPEKTMTVLKGGDSDNWQHWMWVMLQFNPNIFSN